MSPKANITTFDTQGPPKMSFQPKQGFTSVNNIASMANNPRVVDQHGTGELWGLFDFAVQEGSNDGSGQYVFPDKLEDCGKYPIVELTQKEYFLARDYISDFMRYLGGEKSNAERLDHADEASRSTDPLRCFLSMTKTQAHDAAFFAA